MTISSLATIKQGSKIGKGVTLGDYVIVYPDSQIEDGVVIEGFTQILAGVHIMSKARLGIGVCLESNNPSLEIENKSPATIFGHSCRVGAGAIIHRGISIGNGAVVLPGSVVAQNVPANAIVGGSPARITGYVENVIFNSDPNKLIPQAEFPVNKKITHLGVGNVSLHKLSLIRDPRGDLSVGEFESDIPFPPKRYFLVFNVPNEKIRGEHAHHQCHQFIICASGSCSVVVDDGISRCEVKLDSPEMGIYLPPMIWGVQYKYSVDAVLIVFASHQYDPQDYIRDYNEFISITKKIQKD